MWFIFLLLLQKKSGVRSCNPTLSGKENGRGPFLAGVPTPTRLSDTPAPSLCRG